jgi:hypothetical protein
MTERRRSHHNPYQLPLDYGARPLEIGQYVRVLNEPYMVRQPADAALYLLNQVFVPFEQFKQEQLYVLLLDNKNLITHDVMVYKGVRRITTSHYWVDTTLWEGAKKPTSPTNLA